MKLPRRIIKVRKFARRIANKFRGFAFGQRIKKIPSSIKGRQFAYGWRYVDPKTLGLRELPRRLKEGKRIPVHLCQKDIVVKDPVVGDQHVRLTVGISFHMEQSKPEAIVFIVPKPEAIAGQPLIRINKRTSSWQRAALEQEEAELKSVARTLAVKLGIKKPERLEVNVVYA
jgi:hypothetical protein